MTTANQLTFTTNEAFLKPRFNDPIEVIFDNIYWSPIYPLVKDKYLPQGADGYETKQFPLFKERET